MDAFVGDLTRLYRLAAELPVDQFPERAVAQLRDWIRFDGAVFGFGEPGADSLKIGNAVIYNRDPAILRDYAGLSQSDPVTRKFMLQPGRILNVDTGAVYVGKQFQPVARYSASYDLRHLLLLGKETSDRGRVRWIVLYRGTRESFDQHAADRLTAAWDHMLCALELNRLRALDQHAVRGSRRALALVSGTGLLEIADPAFLGLLRKEWRDCPAICLPRPAVQALQAGTPYVGRTLEIRFSRRGDCVLCEAQPQDRADRLSARERQVAELFATGNGYREIAGQLGSSPNTVRAQLARIYQKLDIHDKARLATVLAEQSRFQSS